MCTVHAGNCDIYSSWQLSMGRMEILSARGTTGMGKFIKYDNSTAFSATLQCWEWPGDEVNCEGTKHDIHVAHRPELQPCKAS